MYYFITMLVVLLLVVIIYPVAVFFLRQSRLKSIGYYLGGIPLGIMLFFILLLIEVGIEELLFDNELKGFNKVVSLASIVLTGAYIWSCSQLYHQQGTLKKLRLYSLLSGILATLVWVNTLYLGLMNSGITV